MATKDIGQGWGDLPRGLREWRCPKCFINYPMELWSIVWTEINGCKMDGRKCPQCDFAAYQHGETMAMVPLPIVPVEPPAPIKAKKKRPAAKKRSKPSVR